MIWLILSLALGIRLLNLNQSFWLDEAAQVIESTRPLYQQLDITGDFWPPLYHVLLHFWMYGGRSEIWVRVLSVLFSVVTVYFVYKLAQIQVSEKIALLSAMFLALAPFHVWYSQEARPYMLSTLLGFAATYFLLKKSYKAYVLCGVLFLYSSYVSFFLIVTHGIYIYFFEREVWKQWITSGLIISLSFVPWLPSFWRQLSIGNQLIETLPGWSDAVSTPLHKALPLVFIKFLVGRITFDSKLVYGGIVLGLSLFCTWLGIRAYRTEKNLTMRLGFLCLMPIVLAFVISLILPILAPQRVLFSLPIFYLLLAVGVYSYKKYQWLTASVIICISMYSLFLYNTHPRFQREQWRQAVSFVEGSRAPNSLAIFIFPEAFAPWQWYSRGVVKSIGIAPSFMIQESQFMSFKSVLLKAEKLYVFHYLTDLTDPEKKVPKYLHLVGFIENISRDFPGVGFITTYEKAVAFR